MRSNVLFKTCIGNITHTQTHTHMMMLGSHSKCFLRKVVRTLLLSILFRLGESVCLVERKQQNIFNIFGKYCNRNITILECSFFFMFVTYQIIASEVIKSHLKENCFSGGNNH